MKRKTYAIVAIALVAIISCMMMPFVFEDQTAVSASATKDGVTANYTESGDQSWLYFSFAPGSAIKGDSAYVEVNMTKYGTLDLIKVPYVYLGDKKTGSLTISLTQDGRNVTMTLSSSGSYYGISLTQPANGTIASDKYSAAEGETVKLTATPSSGYILINWIITPSVTVTNNMFIMPAGDVTITAEFAQATLYMVNTEVEGSGSLTASQNYAATGATVTLTVSPGPDSEFKEWKDKSPASLQITQVSKTTYTFKMPAENVSVKAVFQEAAPHAYTVKVSPSDGGEVNRISGTAMPGALVQFTVTPNEGCTVQSVTSVPAIEFTHMENVYGFVMPSEDVTINVIFKTAQSYNITINQASGGSAEASASKSIEGKIVSVTIKPNSGYVFDKWASKTPSNLELTKIDSNLYTFVMPACDVQLTAEWTLVAPVSLVCETADWLGSGYAYVAINIAENPGVSALRFNISYDEHLTLISVLSSGIMDMTEGDLSKNPFGLFLESPVIGDDTIEAGTLVILVFSIEDGLAGGLYPINIIPLEAVPEYGHDLPIEVTDGGVFVCIPGDVNMDGKVSSRDALILRKYLAGWKVELAGDADFNNDGKINLKDSLLLKKYLAGWDVDLGGHHQNT